MVYVDKTGKQKCKHHTNMCHHLCNHAEMQTCIVYIGETYIHAHTTQTCVNIHATMQTCTHMSCHNGAHTQYIHVYTRHTIHNCMHHEAFFPFHMRVAITVYIYTDNTDKPTQTSQQKSSLREQTHDERISIEEPRCEYIPYITV
jgi:hypothetical protein